jgi:hypothetical protein
VVRHAITGHAEQIPDLPKIETVDVVASLHELKVVVKF